MLGPPLRRQVRRSHTMFPCHGVATVNPQMLGVPAARRYGFPVRPSLRARTASLSLQDPALRNKQKSFALRGKFTLFSYLWEIVLVWMNVFLYHFALRGLSFLWKLWSNGSIYFQYRSCILDTTGWSIIWICLNVIMLRTLVYCYCLRSSISINKTTILFLKIILW